MSRKKAIFLYLLGSLGQIWIISMIVFILRNLGVSVDYTTPIGMLAIGLGGVSSALWGIILFLKAILFGGIEEVGWRYVFQPIIMERRSYLSSTLMTFVLWGIWHFAYFYIEGTLPQVGMLGFLLGLLTNCFILSALFIKTKSLWICVMTHSLINVFSQIAVGGNENISYASKVIIIVLAILLALRAQNNKARDLSVI